MPIPYTWTSSMKVAWNFVVSGVARRISATSALESFRRAGLKIRTSSWYDLYREAFAQEGSAKRIFDIPMSYVVPESMFTESPFDWREKFVVQARVVLRDPDTGLPTRRWVTIESDQLITKQEWVNGMQEAINYTPGSEVGIVERVLEWRPYKRVR